MAEISPEGHQRSARARSERRRETLRVSLLRTPIFVRAPTLLRRHATVAIATFAAAAILGMVTAMAPLFISSATNAALAQEITSRCAGSVNGTLDAFAPVSVLEPEVARVWSESSTLTQPPILTRPTPPVEISTTGADKRKLLVRFLHRTGYADNVEVLEQTDPDGLWITDRGADYLGLVAGDDVEIRTSEGTLVSIPVGTVYRDLNELPRNDYWCPVQDYFIPGPPHGDLPPALVLIDSDRFGQLFSNLERAPYGGMWEFPVERSGLTTQSAAASIRDMEQMETDLQESLTTGSSRSVTIRTDLPYITRRAAALGEVLRSSVAPIALVAVASALGLLAAAGSYWVDRRRTEVVLLITKGIAPAAVGLKAVVEMAGVVIVGTIVGWLLALATGPLIGPSPTIDSSIRWQTLLTTLFVASLGLAIVGVVVGVRSAGALEEKKRRRAAVRLPALLGFVIAACLAWFSLRNGAITVAQGDQAGRVGPLVLAFPFFLFGSAILLAAEVLNRLIERANLLRRTHSPTLYLASRRIRSSPTMALVLIAAAAFPSAALVYSANLSRSSSSTIESKAASFIGSDLAVAMANDEPMPMSLVGTATQVTRYERLIVDGQEVDVIGVDPTTFAEAGYWHDSFSHMSIERVLDLLTQGDSDGTLPVVVANGSITGSVVESGRWDEATIPVRVAATIDSFPAMRGDRPLLVADNRSLSTWTHLENGERLYGFRDWVYIRDMTEPEVIAAFAGEDATFAWINATGDVLDQLKYAVIIWTFDFVEVIAVLATTIVVAGVFLYGDARQRSRNLSYALARRMGLTRRSHFMASFLELLVLLGLGLVVGVAAAIAASALVYGGIDPVPTTPPTPRLIVALDVVAIAALATVVVAATGALLTQRIADGADTSELLRHGG